MSPCLGKKMGGNNFFIQNAGPKRFFNFGDKLKSILEKNSWQNFFALLANLHYVEGNNFLPRHSAVFPCINETQNTLWLRGALHNQRTLLVQLFYSCFHGAIFTPTSPIMLDTGHSSSYYSIWPTASARIVSFLNIFLVVILPYVWCLILVFHSPTNAAPPWQFFLESKPSISCLGLAIFFAVTYSCINKALITTRNIENPTTKSTFHISLFWTISISVVNHFQKSH